MNEACPTNDWVVTTKRYVAYCDIMGFKDLVLRATHGEIYEKMKHIQRSIGLAKTVNWGKINRQLVKSTTYSDSIILYSKDEGYDSLYSVICTVAALNYELLCAGVPHKGAVAFGTMTLDTTNSIFFGQPLIDAYLLQDELAFYGIVGHGSFEEQLAKEEKQPWPIRKYSCSFKKGNSPHFTVIPILVESTNPEYKPEIDKMFESVKKMRYKTSGQLRIYVDNTESYLNAMREGAIEK